MTHSAAMPPDRPANWQWRVAVILMLALVLNYSNRLMISQNSLQIQQEYRTDSAGYGLLNSRYSLGFAFGGLIFGILADWISIRWLYPAVVLIWSGIGAYRGHTSTLEEMANCQFIMGLFLAGHWPCALRTTQRLFDPARRTFGNTVLQSGASVGNVLTPLMVAALLLWDQSRWRLGFDIVGVFGLVWAVVWFYTVTEADLRKPVLQTATSSTAQGEVAVVLQEQPFWRLFLTRRWWLLLFTVISINTIWHYMAVWVPDILQKQPYGYSTLFVQYFTATFYAGTFIGSMVTGWLTARLPLWGWSVTRARLFVFGLGGLLTAFAVPGAFLPAGNAKLCCLLIVSLGSLGLFPIYYSLNQELSAKHQGKVGGLLSFCSWILVSRMQAEIGVLAKTNPDCHTWFMAGFSLLPLVALALLLLWWRAPVSTPASTHAS